MKLKLHWQILIAIVLAAFAGWAAGVDGSIFGIRFYAVFDFVGTLFLNALKMLIVPLIASSIIVGAANIGSSKHLGSIGSKTFLFYAITTLAAIVVGLLVLNVVQPGIVDGEPARDLLALNDDTSAVAEKVGDRGVSDVVDIFLRAVPTNIVDAAARGEMLGLIVFCLLFGNFRKMLQMGAEGNPMKRNITIQEVGNAAAFLCSDLASGITGEVLMVDNGYSTVGTPQVGTTPE